MEITPFKSLQSGRNRKVEPPALGLAIANREHLYRPTLLNFSYPVKPTDSVRMLIIASIMGGKDTTAIYLGIPDSFVVQAPIPYLFEPKN